MNSWLPTQAILMVDEATRYLELTWGYHVRHASSDWLDLVEEHVPVLYERQQRVCGKKSNSDLHEAIGI